MEKTTFDTFTEIVSHEVEESLKQCQESLSSHYNVTQEQIALFHSHEDAIEGILRSLKEKKLYLYVPLPKMYEQVAFRAKKFVSKINRLDDIENPPAKKSIVLFANPALPEGEYEEIELLLKMWMQLKCTIIIDESTLEFSMKPSLREHIKHYKRLYILNDFKPFYEANGIALSAIFGHKKAIKKLSPPHSLSALDLTYLSHVLQDKEQIQARKESVAQQRKTLMKLLKDSGLFSEIVPSDTDAILCYSPRAYTIKEQFATHKIVLESCEGYDYLSENWLLFPISLLQYNMEELLHENS